MKILVYADESTRTRYVLESVTSEFLGCDIELTTDIDRFTSAVVPRINYSDKPFEGVFRIVPCGLLAEKEIRTFTPDSIFREEVLYLFPTDGDLFFDVFAASFYLISRYEEYTVSERDNHGRFMADRSILYANDQLKKPVVDIWMNDLKTALNQFYGKLDFVSKGFNFEMTFDIDHAYAYLGKGFFRNMGGLIRDLSGGKFNLVSRRLRTVLGIDNDPYDTYEYIYNKLHKKEVVARWFIPVGDRGPYDKSLPHTSERYRQLIRHLTRIGKVGLHPSYASNGHSGILSTEMERLQNIVGQLVTRSRQHFLKLDIPHTYRNLEGRGIIHDYSMGYAEVTGFRAGTCRPFLFYDLLNENETDIRVHPFVYMDGTFRDYQNISVQEAMLQVETLVEAVRAVDGQFICIWHNHSLSDKDHWEGWRKLFEHTLEIAVNGD